MKNIQAFIFDMDGLLLDTERVYQRSWSEAARRLGFDLNDEIYLMLIGITVADSEKRLAEVFGSRFPIGEFRKDAKSRYETIVETEGIPLKPGVREMLEWARHKNPMRGRHFDRERGGASPSGQTRNPQGIPATHRRRDGKPGETPSRHISQCCQGAGNRSTLLSGF
jgi:beta-phosphoglucomutase-like phosphatase (HAD superfamily)